MTNIDGMSIKKLNKLVSLLDDNEADMFVSWILECMENGFTHFEMCSLYRPHSHSADCDCGGEEVGFKINRTLLGE